MHPDAGNDAERILSQVLYQPRTGTPLGGEGDGYGASADGPGGKGPGTKNPTHVLQ